MLPNKEQPDLFADPEPAPDETPTEDYLPALPAGDAAEPELHGGGLFEHPPVDLSALKR